MSKKLFSSVLAIAFLAGGSSAVHAALFNYSVSLTGPSEFPAVASPAMGAGSVVYDDVAHILQLSVSFNGLIGTTTVSHLHAATSISGVGSEANANATGRTLSAVPEPNACVLAIVGGIVFLNRRSPRSH